MQPPLPDTSLDTRRDTGASSRGGVYLRPEEIDELAEGIENDVSL
jgi:hypothetical protein